MPRGEGVSIANAIVDRSATMYADEGTHWDLLDTTFACGRVNHSEEYSAGGGAHTNWVESYFSRLRRMVSGQHHWVSPKYLAQYASHAAWIEDHRRDCNRVLTDRALRNAMVSPVSREFKGYWQRAA